MEEIQRKRYKLSTNVTNGMRTSQKSYYAVLMVVLRSNLLCHFSTSTQLESTTRLAPYPIKKVNPIMTLMWT